MSNEKFSVAKRIRSFGFAFEGIKTLFKEEHNSWIHLTATIAVIVFGFVVDITLSDWILLAIAIGFVFSMEIMNSAIENIADFISPEKNEAIKKIKDLAAAGVLVSAITSIVIGCIIFIPKIIEKL